MAASGTGLLFGDLNVDSIKFESLIEALRSSFLEGEKTLKGGGGMIFVRPL